MESINRPNDIYSSGESGSVPTTLKSPFTYKSDIGNSRKRRRTDSGSMDSNMESEF